mgnify:CR=1 FL=1
MAPLEYAGQPGANGCYWERQWAYYVVETTAAPFDRAAIDVSSKVGYAGGDPAVDIPGPVCYHSGDERDYSTLGMAEAVLSLEAGWDMRPAPIPAPAMPEAKQRAAMDILLCLKSAGQRGEHMVSGE